MANIRFWLDGCDITFLAEAPEDITLKELLKQCDRIEPEYCACGLKSLRKEHERFQTELIFTKDDVKKADGVHVSCNIHEDDEWYQRE